MSEHQISTNLSDKCISGFVFLAAALYVILLSRLAFDPDLAILTSFAERMLAGYQFSDMYYEANPPLSIILYIPPVWLAGLSGLPIYHASFIYTSCLLAAGYGLSWYMLGRLKGLDREYCHFLALGYLILLVVVPGHNFGDRDHLCIMGVTLVVLAQLILLQDIKIPRLILLASLAIGTFMILVKPHYGLIPTVLLAHRFLTKDGFRVMLQPDFLSLAAGVLLYAAALLVFFHDYLEIVLFDAMKLYAGIRVFEANKFVVIFGMLLLVMWAIAHSIKAIDQKALKIINILAILTLLLFVPYYVQGKGFDYHRIPAYIYWFLTGAIIIFAVLKIWLRPALAKPLAILVLTLGVYEMRGLSLDWLTHEQYKSLALPVTVNKYCPEPCNYLILTDNADDNHRIASYAGHFHGTRFTSMWFLGYIFYQDSLRNQDLPMTIPQAEYDALIAKYIGMIEEDFKRMPPDIIIELTNMITYTDQKYFEFLFKHSPYLEELFQNEYEIIETFEEDRRLYYPGLKTPLDRDPIGKYVVYKHKGFDGYNAKLGPPSRQAASIQK